MDRGCGCMGCVMTAVLAVIAVVGGVIGGGWWLNEKVLSSEPLALEKTWSRGDQISCLSRLAPVGVAVKAKLESEQEVTLNEKELNYLISEYALADDTKTKAQIVLGEETITLRLSRQLKIKKYVNVELEMAVSGENGQFQVRVERLVIGNFTCPSPLLPLLAQSLQRSLSEQKPLHAQRIMITGLQLHRKKLRLTIKTLKE